MKKKNIAKQGKTCENKGEQGKPGGNVLIPRKTRGKLGKQGVTYESKEKKRRKPKKTEEKI